jgi:membrane-associated phospholipid phosphatase
MKYNKYFNNIINENIRDFTSFGNPIILLLFSFLIIGFSFDLIYIILGIILIELVAGGIKIIFFKDRPQKKDHHNILEKIDAGSFPSIHSARACFVFLVIYSLVSLNLAKLALVLLILIVGASRILLKKHYIIDIIGGYILGFFVFFIWTVLR